MKKQFGFTLVEMVMALFIGVVVIGGGIGWIWNIIKLAGMTFDVLTGLLVLRVVGIFVVPLGMVVGYF